MKKRTRTKSKLVANCSEERIFQLSNDVSEDIRSGTVEEWRAVALYFRNLFDKRTASLGEIKMSLAALTVSEEMRTYAMREIVAWLKTNRNP